MSGCRHSSEVAINRSREKEGREDTDESSSSLKPLSVEVERREENGREDVEEAREWEGEEGIMEGIEERLPSSAQ